MDSKETGINSEIKLLELHVLRDRALNPESICFTGIRIR